MNVVERDLSQLKRYENNPRINSHAVDAVAQSIKQFGYSVPIVIDQNDVIVCGDTRYQACLKLGMTKIACVLLSDLSEEKIRAFRILDNKVAEKADWDPLKLGVELQALGSFNFDQFDVDFSDVFSQPSKAEEVSEAYSKKIKSPIYEPTGKKPQVKELYDDSKARQLIEEIDKDDSLDDETRNFLKAAAARHIVFDYQNIAEFYAHASPAVQELMEDSALVIIDFEKAIENGFVDLTEKIASTFLENSGGGEE